MSIQNIINQSEGPVPTLVNHNVCPNCWGYSRWDDKDCGASFDIDRGSSSEVNSRNGFIRRFVKRYLG